MCRFALVYAADPVDMQPFFEAFVTMCQASPISQEDGWGMAYDVDGEWLARVEETPIWDADAEDLPPSTSFLIHARSAFEEHGTGRHLNMPFVRESLAFAFNGEMQGVRMRGEGDSGAHRLHNLAHRYLEEGFLPGEALTQTANLVFARSKRVLGMNMVWASAHEAWITTDHEADPDYYTVHRAEADGLVMVASQPFGPVQPVAPARLFAHRQRYAPGPPMDPLGVSIQWEPVERGERFRVERPS